jgi:endonuclease/exonuclease/phosphatase (EEP) superfamily protein YafD
MSWPRRLAAALAVLYVLSLVATVVAFRYVGERWWVTAAGLYVPRLAFALPLPFVFLALWAARLRKTSWAALAASILVLIVLTGFVFPWPTPIVRGAPLLRVLSFNCNSGIGKVDELVEEIDRFSPDVVLLQELTVPEQIAARLQTRYAAVRIATQFLVASRYPIVSAADPDWLSYEGRPRAGRWIEQVIETPLGRIAFYDVHPLSPREGFYALRGKGLRHEILSGRIFVSANSTLLEENAGLRALQVEDFATAAAHESDPVIIAGDTNLPGLSFVLNRNLSAYKDGFVKAGWGFGYTFPTNRFPWMRIDRILASEPLSFVGFQVGKSLVSDHHCVIADLQRRTP